MKYSLITLMVLLCFACNKDDDSTPDCGSMKYTITFSTIWSRESHPNSFPSNPHFSGLIGMTHSRNTSLFKEGELASEGIKSMAETGSKSPLEDEINEKINSNLAQCLISGDGISVSPGMVSFNIGLDSLHPYVSVVSMLAPSPDWFIAVSNVNLFEEGQWIATKSVPVKIYDAGTDKGVSFASPDEAQIPHIPIEEITSPPLATDGVVPSLGTMIFKKVESTP